VKHKYERLMHIEQVLSKLERCVPMGLRREVEISQALHNVGQLIEDCMEADTKAGKHIIPSYADGKYQEIEFEYNAMQQAIDDEDYEEVSDDL
jgi:hypothetical protein